MVNGRTDEFINDRQDSKDELQTWEAELKKKGKQIRHDGFVLKNCLRREKLYYNLAKHCLATSTVIDKFVYIHTKLLRRVFYSKKTRSAFHYPMYNIPKGVATPKRRNEKKGKRAGINAPECPPLSQSHDHPCHGHAYANFDIRLLWRRLADRNRDGLKYNRSKIHVSLYRAIKIPEETHCYGWNRFDESIVSTCIEPWITSGMLL